jgi:hypothetical protein
VIIKLSCSTIERHTLDGYAASHHAMREMKNDGLLHGYEGRSSKEQDLNNLIEQGETSLPDTSFG